MVAVFPTALEARLDDLELRCARAPSVTLQGDSSRIPMIFASCWSSDWSNVTSSSAAPRSERRNSVEVHHETWLAEFVALRFETLRASTTFRSLTGPKNFGTPVT